MLSRAIILYVIFIYLFILFLFVLFFLIDLYWSIVAVLVSVAQQSKSAICVHMSAYPLPLEPPSHPPSPTPLGHHKAPSRSPCAVLLLPTSQLFYIR